MTATTPSGATPKFYAIDFFCGAGGTTNGLIAAGGQVIAGIDKEGECKKTYEENNKNPDGSNPEYWQLDIYRRDEDYPEGQQEEIFGRFDEKVRPLRKTNPDIPLMLAICAPCQPFTTMTRIQMTDERATARQRDRGLLAQCLDYVDHFEPEMVLCENVAGIQNPKYGGVWQHFMAGLEARGYVAGSAIVDAVNFKVPQHRKRSIMLAVKKGKIGGDWIRASEDGTEFLEVPLSDGTDRRLTVGEAIFDKGLISLSAGSRDANDPNHRCAGLSEINRKRLESVQPGGSNVIFEEAGLGLECHRRLRGGKNSGFTDVYTRMDPEKPSPTITTKCFSVSNGRFGHPRETRAISIREAALLQTFPENYVFHANSLQQQARMVGNAVPPRLAEFFAKHLVEILESKEILAEAA